MSGRLCQCHQVGGPAHAHVRRRRAGRSLRAVVAGLGVPREIVEVGTLCGRAFRSADSVMTVDERFAARPVRGGELPTRGRPALKHC